MSTTVHIATQKATDEYVRYSSMYIRSTEYCITGFPVTLCGKEFWNIRAGWNFVWQGPAEVLDLVDCDACLLVYRVQPDLIGVSWLRKEK